MNQQQFRIVEIEVAKSPTDEKILGFFRFDGNGNAKIGNTLIVMAEISSTLYVYERLLDVINETVERSRHLIAKVEHDPIARFEKLLQHVNTAIAEFLEGEPTPITWGRVSIFLFELSHNHLCLSGRGRLMNIFLQKQDDGSFRNFDLLGSLEQPAEVDPKKFFASLICGDMKSGDILMLGSTNLERLRKELDFKNHLTSRPPVTAALEIKEELEKRGIPDDFLGAVISCCSLEMPEAVELEGAEETDKSTASIRELRETEAETSHQLAPALGPTKKPRMENILRNPRIPAGIFGAAAALRRRLSLFRKKDMSVVTSLRGMNAGHGSMFTKKRKRMAIISAAVVVLSLSGIFFWKRHERLQVEAAVWNAAFEDATDKRHRAESDLIYGNDDRAKRYIDEAVGILGGLTKDTSEQKEKTGTLGGELDGLRERLRKTTTVEGIEELFALSGVADGSMQAPVLAGDYAYAVNRPERKIIKVDLTNKTVKEIGLPDGGENIIAGSAGDRSIIFVTEDGTFYAINRQTDTVSTLSSTPPGSKTADIAIYAGRAYTLDDAGQIWRSEPITGGFGAGKAYIKASNISLEHAVSMAIDSNVYVLKPDGATARFLSGGQEGFALSPIDPELKAASAMWTNPDATRLIVVDPSENRLLVFNKDGTLKNQIISDSFTGLRDLDANEKEKRILIVDGTRLLLVPMP